MPAPIIAGALGSALTYVLSKFVPKLLFALGIGYVAFEGADLITGRISVFIAGQLGNLDPMYAQAWYAVGMPTALAMLFSAISTRLAIQGAGKLVAGHKAPTT